jgi:membrane associated rhomboid family serine protease
MLKTRSELLDSILIIILINVLVFIGISTRTEPIQQQIIQTLGLTPADVWGHPWQIVTSMFTHKEFTHILFNMWTLYFFGSSVLQMLGARRFWVVYIVGGIMGSLVYILLGPSYSTAIGASGAIFALGGALAVLRPNMKVVFFPIPVPMPLWIAIVGSFVIFTLLSIAGYLPIAWEAHLGGLVFGAVAGWLYRRSSLNDYRWN